MAARKPAHPPPRARPGRPPDADKHAAILLHARRLFAEHGFSGANMDVLAEAAGVSKPTIYLHFGSKASLFQAALRELVDRLPAPAALVGAARGTLPERLDAIARDACALATSPLMHDIQRMLARPVDGTGRSRVSFWRECLAPYQQAFSTLLRAEVAAGRMAIDDIEAASSQFFNLVAAEPFIRTLLDDAGDAPPPAGRTEAAVALFLQAYARDR